MIPRKLTYQSRLLNDTLKSNLDLIKFSANLKSMNPNELDVDDIEFEESSTSDCDVLFVFTTKETSAKGNVIDASEALRKTSQAISAAHSSLALSLSCGHLILIYLFLSESEKRELILNCDTSFMASNRMTLLLGSASNPINNLALYDKIKLICSNSKAMLGQIIRV